MTESFRFARVLITGGGGFLGSHLTKSLLSSGAYVRVVRSQPSKTTTGDSGDRHVGSMDQVACDLRQNSLEHFLEDIDLVIHAAAITRPTREIGRRELIEANVKITTRVVDACRAAGVPRFVNVSSTAAIGISPDPAHPADERTQYNLDRFRLDYSLSKRRSEEIVLQANSSVLETVVVNPGFVFGRHGRMYRGAEVISRILDGGPVLCTNGGLSIVHVADVVEGIRRAAESGRPAERYILSGDNVTFREIARIVCRVAGVDRTAISVPDVVRDAVGVLVNLRAKALGQAPNLAFTRKYSFAFYSSAKARTQLNYGWRPFEDIVLDYLGSRTDRGQLNSKHPRTNPANA